MSTMDNLKFFKEKKKKLILDEINFDQTNKTGQPFNLKGIDMVYSPKLKNKKDVNGLYTLNESYY